MNKSVWFTYTVCEVILALIQSEQSGV